MADFVDTAGGISLTELGEGVTPMTMFGTDGVAASALSIDFDDGGGSGENDVRLRRLERPFLMIPRVEVRGA